MHVGAPPGTCNASEHHRLRDQGAAETLVIQGERDMLFPVHLAEEVQQNIKHSKLIVIKNAGHTLNLEHVGEVSAYINEFLN
jgi:pimeloyl-ACP methyl ester carboxylesterase